MKYHSDTLIPHKAAIMSAPANLLAEEVCLPAALPNRYPPRVLYHPRPRDLRYRAESAGGPRSDRLRSGR